MKRIGIVLLISIYSIAGFAQETIIDKLTTLVEKELKKENIHNMFVSVHAPTKEIVFGFESITVKQSKAIDSLNPFYVASIGKTFTATAIALLKEQGKIKFEDKISTYLSKEIIDKLHVHEGVDYSNEITIAQLLQHTSGLSDYFEGTTVDGSPNMINQLFINPTKFWTPSELIEFYKQKMQPLFPPGKGYHYTDTEYVLLGLIIEKISDLELHEFFKEYIFKPLQMQHTYMHLRSTPIKETAPMTEIHVGTVEISSFKSLSADWAGGGVVATADDLIRFQQALFGEKLVKKETLNAMQQWTPETVGMYYGFGLRKIVLNELSEDFPKRILIGHSGSTGSFLYYCPSLDVYISGTLNQIEATRDAVVLLANIIALIERE
jgi:CubicO group peptidase (beta-lactamase class C family)